MTEQITKLKLENLLLKSELEATKQQRDMYQQNWINEVAMIIKNHMNREENK